MNQLLVILLGFLVVGVFVSLVEALKIFFVNRHAKKMKSLDEEFLQLCKEISTFSGPKLTTEVIPQQFPSKEAAKDFGNKWSLGGNECYSAKAIDINNYDENHPKFDANSISGGILYAYPALFFGLKTSSGNSDQWYLEFSKARNHWLHQYLKHLKNVTANEVQHVGWGESIL